MSDTHINEAAVEAARHAALAGQIGLQAVTVERMLAAALPHLHPLSAKLAEQQGDAPFDVTDPWRGLYLPTRMRAASEYGDLTHPDIPFWPDDREDSLDKLVHAQGFDFHIVAGDFTEAALEDGDELYWQEMRDWNPEAPEGEWRLAWKGDTEDGPYAWFVRPMALRPKLDARTARQPGAQEPVGEVYQGSARLPQARLSKPLPIGSLLYAAPPAQGIDLGQFRTQVAELLRMEFDLEVADPEDHRHDDGASEAERIASKIAALIDQRGAAPGVTS